MNKNKDSIIFIVMIVIIAIGVFFNYNQEQKAKNEMANKLAEEKSAEEIFIKELTEKYDALPDQDKDYTIQLQNIFIDSDKPIIFTAFINDFFKKNNQYYIRLEGSDFFEHYFLLRCEESMISKILGENNDEDIFYDEFIVVAQIEDIVKPTLQINGYAWEEYIELEYQTSNIFIETGDCIYLANLEKELDPI